MRVLQICLKPPFPEVDGGCKAMHAITQGFLDHKIEVKVLTISTPKHPFQKEKMPLSYLENTGIEQVFIDTKVTPWGVLTNFFSSKSYNLERFYNIDFENLIAKELQEKKYDIVLLETFFVTGYIEAIRAISNVKIVYQAQNVEHDIWELNAKKEKGLKRWYLNFLAKRLKKAEIENIQKVDGIAPITDLDKNRLMELGAKVPMITIPFGINLSDYNYETPHAGSKVFHIGSMDWGPNQIGIKWLLENVWKAVAQKHRDAELNLAGRGMPSWLKEVKSLNVKVLGEVESAVDFINSNHIMVVPLLTGSGMRIKIIEGMVLGKLVITTAIGASGINYTDKKNIVIANTPTAFSDEINYYLEHQEEQLRIGEAARQLMKNEYDNSAIISQLIAFCEKLNNE
jgi:glycosyltransferase involved in cell wall biosynthesis